MDVSAGEGERELLTEGASAVAGAGVRSRGALALSRARAGARLLLVVAGLALFVVALDLMKTGAAGLRPHLEALDIEGPTNAVGFGWLLAYGLLSGSPVAATSVSLLAGGVFSPEEALAAIAGSRFGASFIVLAVGFLLFLRGRRSADGIAVGVITLLVTYTTQGPALLLGLLSLQRGWLDAVRVGTPARLTSLVDASLGWAADGAGRWLPDGALSLLGVALLLGSFALFDRALPQLEAEAEGIRRVFRMLERRPLMFLMGVLVTLTTMSVSLSVTVLVPLALKGYIRREHIIPYVMGANIATFIDTLAAAVLLGGDVAVLVVVNGMAWIGAVSVALLLFAYRPYRALILGSARWVTARPRNMGAFLAAIVGVPLLLLAF